MANKDAQERDRQMRVMQQAGAVDLSSLKNTSPVAAVEPESFVLDTSAEISPDELRNTLEWLARIGICGDGHLVIAGGEQGTLHVMPPEVKLYVEQALIKARIFIQQVLENATVTPVAAEGGTDHDEEE